MAAWPCLVCFCGLWSPTTQLAFSFFSYTTTPTSHSLSFVLSCLFPCPCPFPVCLCVSVGDGGWAQCFRLFSEFVSVVPPVAITPPPPTPAGLGPASFLPVPRTHPSVLSSSSSSSSCCCCKVDGKASEGFTNHTPPLCFVACPSLFCCVCVVWWLGGHGWWWCWLPRHACLGATSACAFSPSPPTHHASPPSPSPCLLLVHVPTPFATHSHTAKPHHHATHTRVVAGALWCLVCVCVPTVLAVAAPGSPLTRPPTPCAPHHTTPPLAAAAAGGGGCGGGSVGVVACVATWSTHWLCWCCPLPIHTHTHGVMGTWWWWLCVWCGCHHHCAPFPPTTTTVCAAPPCPLCVSVSGGTTHTRPLWCHPRWCECE